MRQVLMFVLLICLSPLSFADTAIDNLSKHLTRLKTMTASFNEVVRDSKGMALQKYKGKMALSRPGLFRWDIKQPMPQLIVADGKKIWVYDKALEQVTVQQMVQQEGSTPALLLTGSIHDVTAKFHIQEKKVNHSEKYRLTPKDKHPSFKAINLYFTRDKLTRMEMRDNLDQLTMIDFSRIQLNRSLSRRLFHFVPPKGVDIIKR